MGMLRASKRALVLALAAIMAFSCMSAITLPVEAVEAKEAVAAPAAASVPFINNAIAAGDCNSSGEVNVADLVRMKRDIAGVASADSVLSDIVCNSYIDASDLASLRRMLLGFEVELNYPRIVRSKYQTNSVIVADADVREFGAVGDGVHDDTAAFVNAMASLGEQGGVVWAPAGRYKLTQNIVVPSNVILQGDFADPKLYGAGETKNGSVLEIYVKKTSNGNNTAFISLPKYSAVRGFMMYYPEQTMASGTPKSYPYTIALIDWQNTTVRDVYLVNSFQGIDDAVTPHNLETLQNIYMTPLWLGMEWQYNNDVARFENINIGPEWWLESGVSSIPNETKLRDWMKRRVEGIKVYSIDNAFASDITINGCNTALYISGGYGKFYGVNINDCNTGISIMGSALYGYTFTNGAINANTVAVTTAADSGIPLAFYNIDMSSAGANVIKSNSNTGITVTGGELRLTTSSGSYAVYNESGYSNIINCGFGAKSSSAKTVYVGEASLNCRFVNFGSADTFSCTDLSGKAKAIFDANEKTDIQSEYTSYARQERSPERKVIYNALNYGVDTTESRDISDTLQYVINVAYAEGGGIVYLPSDDYLLQKPIRVKSGVELRGSYDNPHAGMVLATTFVTDYGRNNEAGAALITLESGAGIRGITVNYSAPRPNNIVPYACTIRGMGDNVYAVNCSVNTAYHVLDFKTNSCDNHYVEAISFGTLKTGIAVGNSEGGVVRDCQSNPAYNRDNRHNNTPEWLDENNNCLSKLYCLDNVTGYIVDNAANEVHFMNFIYGCITGLEITGNTTADIICPGTDQADYGIYIADSAEVSIIAVELPVTMAAKSYGVYLADGYTGKTDMVNALIWAVGESGIYCGGGSINAVNVIFLFESGKNAIEVKAGKALLAGAAVIKERGINYRVHEGSGSLTVFGNYLSNNSAVSGGSYQVSGSGVQDVYLNLTNPEADDSVSFFDTSMKLATDYRIDYTTNHGYGLENGEMTITSSLDGNTNPIINIYRLNNNGVNASGKKYLEFDYYLSDISLFDKCGGNMQLELSSSTDFDVDELIWGSEYFNTSNISAGWNHIVLDLSSYAASMGEFDITNVLRLRMYYVLSGETASGAMKIKNIKFTV